jgi:hypothetical protein
LRQQIRRFLGALRPDIDRVRLPATEIGEDMPETLDDIRVCRRLRVTAMCSGNAGVMQRRQKPAGDDDSVDDPVLLVRLGLPRLDVPERTK